MGCSDHPQFAGNLRTAFRIPDDRSQTHSRDRIQDIAGTFPSYTGRWPQFLYLVEQKC